MIPEPCDTFGDPARGGPTEAPRAVAPLDGSVGPSAAMTRTAARDFLNGQRGATTIGAAVGISILVTALATVMGVVHKIYLEDRMTRGARAGARAVSLAATAPASEAALRDIVCNAVERELGEDEGRQCACWWRIEVEAFATPRALSGGHARGADAPLGGENADMVLVRLSRPHGDWLSAPAGDDPDDPDDPDAQPCPPVDPDASEPFGIVVAALARNEREVRVP